MAFPSLYILLPTYLNCTVSFHDKSLQVIDDDDMFLSRTTQENLSVGIINKISSSLMYIIPFNTEAVSVTP